MAGTSGRGKLTNNYRQVLANYNKLRSVISNRSMLLEEKIEQMKYLLSQKNVSVNFHDEHGRRNTLLYSAVEIGEEDIVRLLLENGADVNAEALGETPLVRAVEDGSLDIIDLLLKEGADAKCTDKRGRPVLITAIWNNDFDACCLLVIEDAEVNYRDEKGDTPLHIAVRARASDVIQLLVTSNVNINELNMRRETALHLAISGGLSSLTTIDLLLSKDADIEAMDVRNQTPLHIAVDNGLVTVVSLLLQKNADVNVKNLSGETPLHKAAANGVVSINRALLEMNADPNIQDKDGETALHKAIDMVSVFNVLFEKNHVMNCTNAAGQTTLKTAVVNNYVDIVNMLLDKNSNPNVKNKAGKTPLHLAVANGSHCIIGTLIRKNADIYSQDAQGNTPLHMAAVSGDLSTVTLLIEVEANISIKNKDGKLPLDLAKERSNEGVVAMLESINSFSLLACNDYNKAFYIDRTVNNKVDIIGDIYQLKSNNLLDDLIAKTEDDFLQLTRDHPNANIHLIKEEDERFVWVKSQGDLDELRPYIDSNKTQSFSEESFLQFVKSMNVVIISALAGMGKSTILSHIAKLIKDRTYRTCVYRINLKNHNDKLKKISSEKFDEITALSFLCDDLIMMKTELEKSVFKRKGKVVLLFDGFDEVSPDCTEVALDLIQNIRKASDAQIWITTRPIMREKLENELHCFSFTLEPFSVSDQIQFLIKFWTHVVGIQGTAIAKITDFASALITQLSTVAISKQREFTQIPLLIHMLGECFVDNIETNLGSDLPLSVLEENITLTDVYKKFIGKKFEVVFLDKCEEESSMEILEMIAFSEIFSGEKIQLFLPTHKGCAQAEAYFEKIRIITVINGKPRFVHRTFAEYFVAVHLVKVLKQEQHIPVQDFMISEMMTNQNYVLIREFMNDLLVNNQPPKEALKEFGSRIAQECSGNRISIACHQSVKEGNHQILIYLLNLVHEHNAILRNVMESTGTGDCSNKTVLQLATESNNALFIETLLDWVRENMEQSQEVLRAMLLNSRNYNRTVLSTAVESGHTRVVEVVLRWTHDNMVDPKEILTEMLIPTRLDGSPIFGISQFGPAHILKTLLQWVRENMGLEVLRSLILQANSCFRTPLHLALMGPEVQCVEEILRAANYLVDEGGDFLVDMFLAKQAGGTTPIDVTLCWRETADIVITKMFLEFVHESKCQSQDMLKKIILANNGMMLHKLTDVDEARSILKWTKKHINESQEIQETLFFATDVSGNTVLHNRNARMTEMLLLWLNNNMEAKTIRKLLGMRNKYDATALDVASQNIEAGKRYGDIKRVEMYTAVEAFLRRSQSASDF